MKKVILCADDYGQSESISFGILDLIQKGRLSATSCMTTTPLWPELAARLKESPRRVQTGLHFNLTEGAHGMPLRALIKTAFRGKLDKDIIKDVFFKQVDLFKDHMGREPDFIDGHQHIQHLPTVREAMVECIREMTWEKMPWVRVSSNGLFKAASFKELVIHLIGASKLIKLLDQYNIPYNSSFQGIYDFHKADHFPEYMTTFLLKSQDGGLIMCHPGLDPATDDPIAHARLVEYTYLASPAFGNQLADLEVDLC